MNNILRSQVSSSRSSLVELICRRQESLANVEVESRIELTSLIESSRIHKVRKICRPSTTLYILSADLAQVTIAWGSMSSRSSGSILLGITRLGLKVFVKDICLGCVLTISVSMSLPSLRFQLVCIFPLPK